MLSACPTCGLPVDYPSSRVGEMGQGSEAGVGSYDPLVRHKWVDCGRGGLSLNNLLWNSNLGWQKSRHGVEGGQNV